MGLFLRIGKFFFDGDNRVSALAILAAASVLTGCAAFTIPPMNTTNQWVIVSSDDPTSSVAQRQVPGGLVTVMCTRDGCQALIVADVACEVGTLLPILLSTEIEAGISGGDCLPDPSGEMKQDQGIILLTEYNLLLAQITLGDSVNIAVPMLNGQIVVFSIEMNGLRKTLEPTLPELFDAPPWPDENDPPPADTLWTHRIVEESPQIARHCFNRCIRT